MGVGGWVGGGGVSEFFFTMNPTLNNFFLGGGEEGVGEGQGGLE